MDYFDLHRGDWDAIYQAPAGSVRAAFNRRFRKAVWGRMALAMAECADPQGGTVLDVGCGTGEFAIRMAERCASRVIGIDSSIEMVRLARAHAEARGVSGRCRFLHSDFLSSDLRGERFDSTVALGVLDYVAEAPGFLAQMWQHSQRRLVVSLPHSIPPRSWLRRIWHGVHGSRIHYYTETGVLALARALGPAEVTVHSIHGSDRSDLLVCGRVRSKERTAEAPLVLTRTWTGPELQRLLKEAWSPVPFK